MKDNAITIGLLIGIAAAGYYFLVYKPKQDAANAIQPADNSSGGGGGGMAIPTAQASALLGVASVVPIISLTQLPHMNSIQAKLPTIKPAVYGSKLTSKPTTTQQMKGQTATTYTAYNTMGKGTPNTVLAGVGKGAY